MVREYMASTLERNGRIVLDGRHIFRVGMIILRLVAQYEKVFGVKDPVYDSGEE
jgi:hypothetical protein